MTHTAAEMGVPRYFFSSSVCVYRDMKPGEPELTEDDAIPAHPDNEYGWEKLYAERVAMAYGRYYPMKVRIARFQNCYGPEGTLAGRTGEGAGGDLPQGGDGWGRWDHPCLR
jgi:GDP-D-mannose 3',5'-epimerase